MKSRTPYPFARGNQLVGVPEHPCETIFRNGAIISPYEEMEVQFYEEHIGLYLIPLLGEPFELFGKDGCRAAQGWENDHLPIAIHTTEQLGCRVSVTAFCSLLEGEQIVTGEEPLIQFLRYQVENKTDKAIDLPLTLIAGDCFRPPIESDREWDKFYWKEFLYRDIVYEILTEDREPQSYAFGLKQEGNTIVTDKGEIFLVTDVGTTGFTYHDSFGDGTWAEGTHYQKGIRFDLHLEQGQTETVTIKVPYLPMAPEKLDKLKALTWDDAHAAVAALWDKWLAPSSKLTVPGTKLHELWNMQTAITLMLVDKQNKGSEALYGRDMIERWGASYPDRVLCYPHLTPTLYEFLWAQECAYWVVGMLDKQGYHEKAEEYLEVFFALQGRAPQGVHDPSILPPAEIGQAFSGTICHAWLNSNGAILGEIANHYRLTKNKKWIMEHLDAILSSLRWFEYVRKSTKTPEFEKIHGYGLMPPGQSTDSDLASDHVQWFYTDIWTVDGVCAIADVLLECGVPEAEHFKAEADDYRDCFLRALDAAIIDVDDLPEDIAEYDFSHYLYNGPLERDRYVDFDENGIPLVLKPDVLNRSAAKELGMTFYLHTSTTCCVPLKRTYLCNEYVHALGLLYRFIDFGSAQPLIEGARHSGKDVWQAITDKYHILEQAEFDTDGVSYNEYFFLPHTALNHVEEFEELLAYTLRYGCDPENHMTVEGFGLNTREMWFQPSPFALSMSTMRRNLHRMLVFENDANNHLEICKMLPKAYVENTVTYEKPIMLQNAATDYGHVTVTYRMNAIEDHITIQVKFDEPERMPALMDVYFRNPLKQAPTCVLVNGKKVDFDPEKVTISTESNKTGAWKIMACYDRCANVNSYLSRDTL